MLSVETEAYDLGYKLSSGCTIWLIGKYYQYMSCVVSKSLSFKVDSLANFKLFLSGFSLSFKANSKNCKVDS